MNAGWMTRVRERGVLLLGAALACVFASCEDPSAEELAGQSAAITATGPLVRGYLAVSTGATQGDGATLTPKGEDLYLPDVSVYLRNASTGVTSDSSLTDLSGRFTVRVSGPGRYQLCWKAPNLEGCNGTLLSISGKLKNIGTVRIAVKNERGKVALYGRVTLADGSSARSLDPQANVNAFAKLTLTDDRGNTIGEAPVTNFDTYFFPSVPAKELLTLRIEDEGYKKEQAVVLTNTALTVQKLDLRIANYAPEIEPLVALDSAQRRVTNAAAGARVTLNARVSDRDGNPLSYLWRVTSGSLSSPTDPAPTWTLPRTPGNHVATLLTYDGRGGYASASVNLTIDRAGVTFSGTVKGTDAAFLSGAQVEVNGALAVTDSSGFFRVKVPDRKRFVMNIRKNGYAFSSNVYYDKVVGGTWRLTKAEVFHVDPRFPIDIQNRRSPRECPGPLADTLDWKGYPALAKPQYQDGHGNIIPTPEDSIKQPGLPDPNGSQDQRHRECGPGVRIQIPANGIVDAAGNAPPGLVDIQLSTVDLATGDQMPGDYTVDGGKMAVSYGAGSVEIFAGGTKYNLRPGIKAKVIIPVDQAQIAAGGPLAPTIPLLRYDEPRGVWVEEGTLTLQNVGGVFSYVTDVPHFTAYNSDLIKTGQSCLTIQNISMPANYRLEVTVPQGGGAAPAFVSKPGVIGGNNETVLLNLPAHTNITLVPVRTTDPDPNKNELPIGVFVVNTGEPQNMLAPLVPGGFPNEPMGPPYYHETAGVSDGACSTKVELRDLGLAFYPDTPSGGAYLHGMNGFAAVNLTETDPAFAGDTGAVLRNAVAQASIDYRGQIDPRTLRPTLSCFKVVNRMPLRVGESCPEHTGTGFTPQAALGETSAVYSNTIDLGFGRDMHCVQNGGSVACYVSNYDSLVYTGPGSASDVSKAQSAVDGHNGLIAPDATVAMEFSPIEDDTANGTPVTDDGIRTVKFYVYNQAGQPLDAANLDGRGARPVPQLCMVCHGGYLPNSGPPTTGTGVPTPVFGSRDDVRLDSRFLPFDLRSFSYAAPDSDAANPFNKLNQQDEFRTLNEMAKLTMPIDFVSDPFSDAYEELYEAWYPGGAIPQVENAVVDAWDTDNLHRTTYSKVVGTACRTCHIANVDGSLRFERPGASAGVGFEGRLGAIQQRVCKEHVMPHARRTHDKFWTSVNESQPALLQAYGDSINAFGWQDVNQVGVDPELACGQEFTAGGGPITPVSQFTPVQVILSSCAGCHSVANDAAGDFYAHLTLTAAASYGELVGVPAYELPSMSRVSSSGNENNSYLWRKLTNTHTGLGSYTSPGPGVAMPYGSTGLIDTDPADAETVRLWLVGGALP